jgi:hypothetical protein
MNEQQLRQMLSEKAEELAPSDMIDLWPEIEKRLAAYARSAQRPNRPSHPSLSARAVRVVLAVCLVGLVVLTTPLGRVWAQEFIQFFTRLNTDTLPVQSWQLTPQPTLAPDPANILEAKLSVKQVAELSGLDVNEPAWLPQRLTLVGATYDSPRSLVRIFYRLAESNGLVLKEEFYSSPDACSLCEEVGASASVEHVQVEDTSGEYVQGVWKLTDQGPVWENDPYLQTLRWQTAGVAYELQYMGPPDAITKADLVNIANSLP